MPEEVGNGLLRSLQCIGGGQECLSLLLSARWIADLSPIGWDNNLVQLLVYDGPQPFLLCHQFAELATHRDLAVLPFQPCGALLVLYRLLKTHQRQINFEIVDRSGIGEAPWPPSSSAHRPRREDGRTGTGRSIRCVRQ